MEKKYESLTLFEFQEKFPDNDSCQQYLAEMKWPGGFKCERCHLVQIDSGKKGKNFPDLHRTIMMFKAWLRGIHHSVDNLQGILISIVTGSISPFSF